MKKPFVLAAGSALLALSACNFVGSSAQAGGDAATAQVDAQALQAAVQDPRVRRFYEARNWQPVWTAQATQRFEEALGDAKQHALDRDTYLQPVNTAAEGAAREAARTLAAIEYGEALARGATDPTRVFEIYEIPRPQVDLAQGLNQALGEGGDLRAFYAGLAPQDEEYRLLSQAFVRYHDMAEAGKQQAEGRTPAQAPASNKAAPAPAAQPVSPEQRDEALNRARQLAVNLERRRWLQRDVPGTRVDVNLPAAMLTYWRDGTAADRRRVVVGEPGNETPELQSPMFRLVANPTWTVPKGIAEEEILPKGDSYMRRNNMTMKDGWVVQEPGPQNSLGLVKFDMKNDHAIYLHDTPAKALFSQDERYRSHGCVRVQDALGFARMIAQEPGVLDQFNQAQSQADREETFIPLAREIPVRLLYLTAVVDNGQVVFLPDPYRWDDRVAVALGREASNQPPAPRTQPSRDDGDIGP